MDSIGEREKKYIAQIEVKLVSYECSNPNRNQLTRNDKSVKKNDITQELND